MREATQYGLHIIIGSVSMKRMVKSLRVTVQINIVVNALEDVTMLMTHKICARGTAMQRFHSVDSAERDILNYSGPLIVVFANVTITSIC